MKKKIENKHFKANATIIQIINTGNKLYALDKKGNIYILEESNGGEHYWRLAIRNKDKRA